MGDTTFIEELQIEKEAWHQISTNCQQMHLLSFADLIWPEDQIEIWLLNKELGIQFLTDTNIFVLKRITKEIRYCACSTPSSLHQQVEIGLFSSISDALAFGVQFLVRKIPLAEIAVPRQTRYGPRPVQ